MFANEARADRTDDLGRGFSSFPQGIVNRGIEPGERRIQTPSRPSRVCQLQRISSEIRRSDIASARQRDASVMHWLTGV